MFDSSRRASPTAGGVGIDLIRGIGGLEEVHNLQGVIGRGHPLGRVSYAVFWLESEFFETTICQVFDIVINVISVHSEDPPREHVTVILLLHLDSLNDHIVDLGRELVGGDFGVFLQHRQNEVHPEFQM